MFFWPMQNNRTNVFPKQLISQTWLREPPWLLVVKQDYSEEFKEVNRSNYGILAFLHLSALTLLTVSVLTARHMISVIKKRDVEADQLNIQLVHAGKLAAVGELSAGVSKTRTKNVRSHGVEICLSCESCREFLLTGLKAARH